VNAEYLRPNSATPFESLKPTLIIEYSPSMSRPVKKVMLISTENIKTLCLKKKQITYCMVFGIS
jgi:hypothetical protein